MEQRPQSGKFRQIKFNNSKGFEKSANNSKGFEVEGKSQLQQNMYSSQLFNGITSENAFAATMKMELMTLQEQINLMDQDLKIRRGTGSEFNKNYVKQVQKWVNANGQYDAGDLLEQKVNYPLDTERLCASLNVKNSDEGLKKLFKILQIIELMIQKVTEYESIFFLKYNDNFCSLAENQMQPLNSKVNVLMQGLTLNKFTIVQANMERQLELFDILNKSKNEVKMSQSMVQEELPPDFTKINSLEDLVVGLKNNYFRFPKEESQVFLKILNKSSEKEIQLSKQIDELQKDIISLKSQSSSQTNQATYDPNFKPDLDDQNAKYYTDIIDEVKEIFENNTKDMQSQIQSLQEKLNDLTIKKQQLEKEIEDQKDSHQLTIIDNNKLRLTIQSKINNAKELQDAYEIVLKEEFDNMKNGFIHKLNGLSQQIIEIKRQKAKEVLELQKDLKRENDTKKLLLKKLSVCIKI